MTKAELIERVYAGKHLPRELTKKTVAQIVDAVFVEMGDYFIRTRVSRTQGPRLTYPGFGTFSKRRRPPRMVKNPKTGAPITIPQQETITFSPGQELRSLLNRNGKSDGKSEGRSDGKSGGAAPATAKSASAGR
jgi:nucleoid DNA-binding protein